MSWSKTLFLSIIVIMLLGIFYFLRLSPHTNLDTAQSLYGAIAEGYLAFFALALTLVFVVIQLSPYSHVELAGYIFDIEVVLYILLLVCTIFFPFLMLMLAIKTSLSLFISISLAIASFLMFPSLLEHIRDKLIPENIIANTVNVVERNISGGKTDKIKNQIDRIFHIITKANMLNDYLTIEHALDGYEEIFKNAAANSNVRFEVVEELIERIKGLRIIFVGNSFSTEIMLKSLVQIGKYSIRYDLPKADIGRIMEIVELIPWQAINLGDSLDLQKSIKSYNEILSYMADVLHNKDYQSSLAKWYVLIGAYGLQKSDNYCQRIIITSLKSLINSGKISYRIACQEALNAVNAELFWELEAEFVTKFINSWPKDQLLKFKSCMGIDQPIN